MGSVSPKLRVGRYALYGEIARGGMATVHFGRLLGSAGFSRTVAIKRLHPHLAKDAEFRNMFLDESRLAGRIHHPNVVQTLDVVLVDGELFLVMEYLEGESLARLAKTARDRGESIPLPVVSAILCGALNGLHAAHEATDELGARLGVVHRDVSPHNILVGADGVPRIIDFGVARAVGRLQMTMEGQIKGKVAYMSPEQLLGQVVDPRADVYAAGAVLWELLTGKRLFDAETHAAIIASVLMRRIPAPSEVAPGTPKALSDVVMRALERTPEQRFATAREMALALEAAVPVASVTQVSIWVTRLVGDDVQRRAQAVLAIENDSGGSGAPSASAMLASGEAAAEESAPRSEDRPRALSQSGTLSRGSSISVLPDAPRAATRSDGGLRVWVVGAVGLLVAVGAVAIARSRGIVRLASTASAASAVATAIVEPASPPPPPQTAPPVAPDAGAAFLNLPGLTLSLPSSPLPAAADGAPSATAPVAPTHAPAAPARANRDREPGKTKPCTVTTYIDDDGFTHFAKECR